MKPTKHSASRSHPERKTDGQPENRQPEVDHPSLLGRRAVDVTRGKALGWRGYRTDEPYTDDVPAVAWLCPYCAVREFG
jgi:hypothetical protein